MYIKRFVRVSIDIVHLEKYCILGRKREGKKRAKIVADLRQDFFGSLPQGMVLPLHISTLFTIGIVTKHMFIEEVK
jgi:hypothetical protein